MKSYLKFLSRNKLYTAIEAVGLAVSLAFVILIGSYVVQQWRMTRNIPGWKDTYAVQCMFTGESEAVLGCFPGLSGMASASMPEIEKSARFFWTSYGNEKRQFIIGGENRFVKPCLVDREIFDFFPTRFLEGSPEVLDDPSNIIVSRSFANSLGQEGAVLGMECQLPDTRIGDNGLFHGTYRIAAIVEDWNQGLLLQPDLFFKLDEGRSPGVRNTFGIATFFRMKEGADRDALEKKMTAMISRLFEQDGISEWLAESRLVRYDELFFSRTDSISSGGVNIHYGDWQLLKVMMLVAFILLVSALFNYVNLNVALSGRRAKEIATRRILGADKKAVFSRFLLESSGFTAICFVAAWLLALALLPTVNRLLGASVPIQLRITLPGLIIAIVLLLIVSVLQAVVPAVTAVRIEPVAVVKGEWRVRSKRIFSKVFIGLQSAFSILLVSLAIVLQLQLTHMLNRPVGANMDNVFYLKPGDVFDLQRLLLNRLTSLSEVDRIGWANAYPGNFSLTHSQEQQGAEIIPVARMVCDSTAFDIFRFRVKERFGPAVPGSVWLSEQDMAKYGLDRDGNEIAQKLSDRNAQSLGGILEDYVSHNIMQFTPDCRGYVLIRKQIFNYFGLVLEINGDHREGREAVMNVYSDLCQEVAGTWVEPLEAGFVPDLLAGQVARERDKLRLVQIYMIICLMLSVLGLVAMSTYYASENVRNIAVRKVFGGTVWEEVWRSVTAYLLLVLASAVVAVPAAVWLCGRFLERYPYRIEGYGWVFAAVVIFVLVVSFVSVLWQTLKAARTNPAMELKKE